MRQSVEVLRRSSPRWGIWGAATVFLAWVSARGTQSDADVSSYPTETYYDLVFAGALLALALAMSSLSPIWSWNSPRRAFHVGLAVATGILAPLSLVTWISGGETAASAWLAGTAHLALLAVISSRLTPSPRRAVGVFALVGFALPALLPMTGPLLDTRPAFEGLTFPRSPAALAPILTLAVIALALPSRPISALLRGAQE